MLALSISKGSRTGELLQHQFDYTSPTFCNPDGACADIQESIHLARQEAAEEAGMDMDGHASV